MVGKKQLTVVIKVNWQHQEIDNHSQVAQNCFNVRLHRKPGINQLD